MLKGNVLYAFLKLFISQMGEWVETLEHVS